MKDESRIFFILHLSAFILFLEPAGDRIAAEADDAAAITINLGNQSVVNLVELLSQLVNAAPGADLLDQSIGKGDKAGDVGEHDRASSPVGQKLAPGDDLAAVWGKVGL